MPHLVPRCTQQVSYTTTPIAQLETLRQFSKLVRWHPRYTHWQLWDDYALGWRKLTLGGWDIPLPDDVEILYRETWCEPEVGDLYG